MALEFMKSNLKNLKFGKDTQGGGSSGLPYIKPGLPEDSPAGEYLAGLARTSADFPLRGGTYSTIASTEDTIRISRFLTDFPKGAIFTSKQVGLQKSNPKIETGERGSRLNTQTYNLNANLLAQVFEQGTGTHINRAGFNINELNDDKNKYAYIVADKDRKNSFNNRLVTLFHTKIFHGLEGTDVVSNADGLGITKDRDTLFQYVGGPDSNFGDGETLISRFTNTSDSFDTYKTSNLGFTNETYSPDFIWSSEPKEYSLKPYGTIRPQQGIEQSFQGIVLNNTLNYNQLLDSKVSSSADVATVMSDFRYENLFGKVQSRNYKDPLVNLTTRVGIGNPGARTNAQRKGTNIVTEGGQDKVNMIPLYTEADEIDPFIGKKDARDLIKFAFEVINNDNPSETTRVHFRAFITNFSDNHTANWNGQNYMGRGEKFYTYQGFDRQFSFQFKVVAQSKQEMLPLYQKLNYIVSSLYPDYSDQGFMRGNLHKLTVGEYFCRTPGIITSMNITVDDNYPWEIKYSEPETESKFPKSDLPSSNNPKGSDKFEKSNSDADMMELPQVLNVSVSFIPILSELPSLSEFTNKTKGGKHILISNRGIQENFIDRINQGFPKPELNIKPETPVLNDRS